MPTRVLTAHRAKQGTPPQFTSQRLHIALRGSVPSVFELFLASGEPYFEVPLRLQRRRKAVRFERLEVELELPEEEVPPHLFGTPSGAQAGGQRLQQLTDEALENQRTLARLKRLRALRFQAGEGIPHPPNLLAPANRQDSPATSQIASL